MENDDLSADPCQLQRAYGDQRPATLLTDLISKGRTATHQHTSTNSSESQHVHDADGGWITQSRTRLSTNPTSWLSDSVELVDPKPIDSDLEAQHGSSDEIRRGSSSAESSSSYESQGDLPKPTTLEQIREIGHHLPRTQYEMEAAGMHPRNKNEARRVINRKSRARATNRAADDFQSHFQPEPSPELSIQREQIRDVGNVTWTIRKRKQAYTELPIAELEAQPCQRKGNHRYQPKLLVLAVIFGSGVIGLALMLTFGFGNGQRPFETASR